MDKHNEDKKKKANTEEQVLDGKDVKGKARIENDIESDTYDNLTQKQKSRKVSFSDEVEVGLAIWKAETGTGLPFSRNHGHGPVFVKNKNGLTGYVTMKTGRPVFVFPRKWVP